MTGLLHEPLVLPEEVVETLLPAQRRWWPWRWRKAQPPLPQGPPPLKPVEKLLTDARDLIVNHGWIQNAYGDTKYGFCMVGALAYAERPYRPDRRVRSINRRGAERLLMTFIRPTDKCYGVIEYNDMPFRSKDQVLSVFNKAIIAAHKQKV